MRWPLVLGVIPCLWCAAASNASAAECDTAPWLSEAAALGEEGFHFLCVTSANAAQLYVGAVATDSPVALSWGDGGFRESIEDTLRINKFITYKARKVLQWKKQPWSVFTARGEKLRPHSEGQILGDHFERSPGKAAVLLLFEGGTWRWPTIRLGYVRAALPGVFLRTVSRVPALFEVNIESQDGNDAAISPGLLTNVIRLAKQRLGPSLLEGKVNRQQRSSEQVFLEYGRDAQLRKLQVATGQLLRAPHSMLEELQVLRYEEGQHYDAHRDYWDPREFPDLRRFQNEEGFWHQRHATLLWYLSAPDTGGETWFPRAHGGPIPWGAWTACDDRGVKVSPSNATAVLFYSLRADGDIDEYSWHCGCPVTAGTKWAANSWLKNSPYGRRPEADSPTMNMEL